MSDFRIVLVIGVVIAALAAIRRTRLGAIPAAPREITPSLSRPARRYARYRVLFCAMVGLMAIAMKNSASGDRIEGEAVAVQAIMGAVLLFAYVKMRRYQREAQQETRRA